MSGHDFKYKGSSCRVEIWERNIGTLVSVRTPAARRRQGNATGMLRMVCEWADKNGIMLELLIMAYGDGDILDHAQLQAFYEKFDFFRVPYKPEPALRKMLRTPRKNYTSLNERRSITDSETLMSR
jgi:GNAT superfamily N-acetyltransferase